MAKITARGAREVARITAAKRGTEWLWVMCSDGRVLTRIKGPDGNAYAVRTKVPDPAGRTRANLIRIAERDGMTVTPPPAR